MSEDKDKVFNCVLNEFAQKHEEQALDIFLLSGIKLVGYIVETCDSELLFRSAIDGKEGIIMYSAIASIFTNPSSPGKSQNSNGRFVGLR